MKPKEILISMAALLAIGLTSLVALRYEKKSAPLQCSLCNRPVSADMAYEIDVGSHIEYACCPRCGMHFHLSDQKGSASQPQIRRELATDFDTMVKIPAETAYYVEGGNVMYCAHEHPVEREPHSISVREYDRCLPTLVAFKTIGGAETYQKQHGGRVLTYQEALESTRNQ